MEDFEISEEEMKAWQEKQQKRDQLSSTMGEYLLKGYRMLDSCCSHCGSILMNPPGSASDVVCLRCVQDANGKESHPQSEKVAVESVAEATPTDHTPTVDLERSGCHEDESVVMASARRTLLTKLAWASGELEHCSSVESCNQLCRLIQTITVTLKHLKPSSTKS